MADEDEGLCLTCGQPTTDEWWSLVTSSDESTTAQIASTYS